MPTIAVGILGTAAAADLIAKEEGLPKKGKAYWDPDERRLVSIGYGHQIQENEYAQGFIQAGDEKVIIKGDRGIDTVMTPKQSKKLLNIDLPKYEERARKPLGNLWNKLNDNQKNALISYAYNTGSTISLMKAGLGEAIEKGDLNLAASIIRDKGIRTSAGKIKSVLVERRIRESELFKGNTFLTQKQVANLFAGTDGSGNSLNNSSVENAEMKKLMRQNDMSVNINAPTTVINKQNPKQSISKPTEADKPAIAGIQ